MSQEKEKEYARHWHFGKEITKEVCQTRGVGQWPYIVNYYGHLDKEDPIFGTAVEPLPLSTALSH